MSLAKASLLPPMWHRNWTQNHADSSKLQTSLVATKISAENKKLRSYKRRFQQKIRDFAFTNQVFNVTFKERIHTRRHTHTHTPAQCRSPTKHKKASLRHTDTNKHTHTHTHTHTHAGMRKLCINKQRLQMKERHFTLRISSSHALLKKTAHIVDPCP